MKVSRFFAVLAVAFGVAAPSLAVAQSQGKVPRIAYLSIPQLPQWPQALRDGLRDYGYVDGQNIRIDFFTAPTTADLASFAAKAVATQPDLIFTFGTSAAQAAKAATTSIPVVFTNATDPLSVVQTLAHPGANVTGNTQLAYDLVGKQMAIIKELVPDLKRIAILNVPAVAATARQMPEIAAAATALGIEPVVIDRKEGVDFDQQFEQVAEAGVQAIFGTNSTYLNDNRDALGLLQVRYKLPVFTASLVEGSDNPSVGGVGYGAAGTTMERQAASCVDAILKGAKPADLPVQQPTAFSLVANLRVAKAMGFMVPPSILAQATQVIQ